MKRIKGTYHLSKAGFEADEIRALILKRRLQILVHSCIYYHYNSSLVSDSQWQKWADELVVLQKKYPYIAKRVDYHKSFRNFDASTGFDLPITNQEILRKAKQLLGKREKDERRKNSKRLRHGPTPPVY